MSQCGSCDFWHNGRIDTRVYDHEDGQCRRHAPSIFQPASPASYPNAMWPMTSAAHGCGDYQRHPVRRLVKE